MAARHPRLRAELGAFRYVLASIVSNMGPAQVFYFLDPGILTDGELRLVLEQTIPPHFEKGGVPAYSFKMCVGAGEEKVGGLRFRLALAPGLEDRGHIGFNVDPAFRGQHFAERACRLILPLARQHGLNEITITCNPTNEGSKRTIERLGAKFDGIIDFSPESKMRDYLDGDTQRCRYRLRL